MEKKYQAFRPLRLTVSLMLVWLLAACGAKRALVAPTTTKSKVSTAQADKAPMAQLAFVQKVADQKVYAKNIVGNMTFNIRTGSKDITVPGSLHMRKDEVIRLQLFIPLLGSEVGRLEFTPDYVLVVDRLHKEYIKADYRQIDFLQRQGLNFYSLQALFWNQLLLPGHDRVGERDLAAFTVDLGQVGKEVPVSYTDKGMTFRWLANASTGRIGSAHVSYQSGTNGLSTLDWQYDDFRQVGVKIFPATQSFTLKTQATKNPQTVSIELQMNNVSTDDKWEAHTKVSEKYKNVAPIDVLGKIMNF